MTIRSRMDKLRTLQGIDATDPFHAPDTLPFRAVTVPLRSGSDPDVIELDDATEAVGDWPEIDTPCDDDTNPGDQCVYNADLSFPEHRRCLYCKKLTG